MYLRIHEIRIDFDARFSSGRIIFVRIKFYYSKSVRYSRLYVVYRPREYV